MSVRLPSTIPGVFEIRSDSFTDSRGKFFNLFRRNDVLYEQVWSERSISQVNLSLTKEAGCIRGLHLQSEPYSECKLVRCLRGRIWDVAVDLRTDSCTFGQWHAVELRPDLGNALLIPEGCAHGFQVMEPHSELLYLHSGAWVPSAETGIRFDDPKLSISWPLDPQGLSDRDLHLPYL